MVVVMLLESWCLRLQINSLNQDILSDDQIDFPFQDPVRVVLAIILGGVMMPFLLIPALLLVLTLRESPLFTQLRTGKDGRLFKLYKLKTMRSTRDQNGDLIPDNERLTNVGVLVRRLSLDELPQLLNIIKGDMAFIGPRPLLPEYLPLYSKQQMRRHEVLPGLTGLAQVSGRNALTWSEKFDLDVYYVDNKSIWLDIEIVVKTILKMVRLHRVASQESAPAQKFDGTN